MSEIQVKEFLKPFIIDRNDFKKLKDIGQGATGSVFTAKQKSTGRICAVKVLLLEKLKGKHLSHFISEIETLALCDHMSIVKFIGFTTSSPYLIVTEYVPGGSLDSYLPRTRLQHPPKTLNNDQLTVISAGLAEALRYMHSRGIIHRDIKPANVLLTDKKLPIVCDLGLAKITNPDDPSAMTKKIGTPIFMAPEVMQGGNYTEKADVYSYGMTLYQISEHQLPFNKVANILTLQQMVISGKRPAFDLSPAPIRDLISRCWQNNPDKRPSFEEIVELFRGEKLLLNGARPRHVKSFFKLVDSEQKKRAAVAPTPITSNINLSLDVEEETEVSAKPKESSFNIDEVIGGGQQVSDFVVPEMPNFVENENPKKDNKLKKALRSFKKNPLNKVRSHYFKEVANSITNGPPSNDEKPISLRRILKVVYGAFENGNQFLSDEHVINSMKESNILKILPTEHKKKKNHHHKVDYPFKTAQIIARVCESAPQLIDNEFVPIINKIAENSLDGVTEIISAIIKNHEKIQILNDVIGIAIKIHPIPPKSIIFVESLKQSLNIENLAPFKNDILKVIIDYTKSIDDDTAKMAFDALITENGDLPIEEIFNDFLKRENQESLKEQMIALLLKVPVSKLENCNLVEFAIKTQSKAGFNLLLKIAQENPQQFLKTKSWIDIGKVAPTDAVKISLVLFKDSQIKDELMKYVPSFIADVITANQTYSNFKEISDLINEIEPKQDIVDEITKTGAIKKFYEKALENSTQKTPDSSELPFVNNDANKAILFFTEALSKAGYTEDYIIIFNRLADMIKNPDEFGPAVKIISILSSFKECAKAFSNMEHVVEFFRANASNPEFQEPASLFLKNISNE